MNEKVKVEGHLLHKLSQKELSNECQIPEYKLNFKIYEFDGEDDGSEGEEEAKSSTDTQQQEPMLNEERYKEFQ